MAACIADASAYLVTPLAGSTPQRAEVGQVFPNVIGVAVTDDNGRAVPRARVSWTQPQSLNMETVPLPGCVQDAGVYVCGIMTDEAGVARLPRFYLSAPGIRELRVDVEVGDPYAGYFGEGTAFFQLAAGPVDLPARMEAISGGDQVARAGSFLPTPFRIRLTRADGTPLENQTVRFVGPAGTSQPAVAFHAPPDPGVWIATTDADGYAQAGRLNMGWGIGVGVIRADHFDPKSGVASRTSFQFRVTDVRGGNSVSLQDMWWGGSKENGWGVAVAQHKERLFAIVFAYDAVGQPTWYSVSDGRWSGGVGNRFAGSYASPKGTPFYSYDATRLGDLFDTGRYGTAVLNFQGEDHGTLDMFSRGAAFSKSIERFDFSKDVASPTRGVGDLWWGGPGQNGWGVSIMEQGRAVFGLVHL
jgi:hypothetical protein